MTSVMNDPYGDWGIMGMKIYPGAECKVKMVENYTKKILENATEFSIERMIQIPFPVEDLYRRNLEKPDWIFCYGPGIHEKKITDDKSTDDVKEITSTYAGEKIVKS